MTLKADTQISTEDLSAMAKDMVANAATSARAPALALIAQLADRLDTYHKGVKGFADLLEQHEYAHQFVGSGLVELERLDVALGTLTSHANRDHSGHCVLQAAMNEVADLLATARMFSPGELTMALVNQAISRLRERPSIRDGRQPTLVEQLVQQLEDATRQCALQADLLKEALPEVREGLAGTSAVDLASRIEDALTGKLPVLDNTPDCVLSADQTELLRRSLTNFGIASPESLEELAIRQRHYVLRLIRATQQDGTLGAILHQSRAHFDQLLESGRCETSAEIDLAVNMIDLIDSHLQGGDPKYAMLVTREQHAELTSLLARTEALLQKEAATAAVDALASAPMSQEVVRTAPFRIWLQVSDEGHHHSEPFPKETGEVTWCSDSMGGCQVPYVRADLIYGGLQAQCTQLREALQEARTGLIWYQETYPEAANGSDDEAMARIDAALAGSEGGAA